MPPRPLYYGPQSAQIVSVGPHGVKVVCPKVYGKSLSPWCRFSFSGKAEDRDELHAGVFVWIECRGGDPRKPVLIGKM